MSTKQLFSRREQKKIQKAKVLIVGVGGLGCNVAKNLALAGLGTIGLCDGDRVEESNIFRQVLFSRKDIGKKKTDVASRALAVINPSIHITKYSFFLRADNAEALFREYDIIIDAVDQLEAEFLINDCCVAMGKPFVYGAVSGWRGQVALCNVSMEAAYSINLRGIFANERDFPRTAAPSFHSTVCATAAVQSAECIKYILKHGNLLINALCEMDLLSGKQRVFTFRKT